MNQISTWSLTLAAALAFSPTLEAAQKKQAHKNKGAPVAMTAKSPKAMAMHQAPKMPNRAVHQRQQQSFAKAQQRHAPANQQRFANTGKHRRPATVAFGGNTQRTVNQSVVNRTDVRNFRSENRVYNVNRYSPPVTVYQDWDRGRIHHWNNHRYHWWNNAWVILDVPTEGYASYDYDSGSLAGSVQAALAREGYRPGPIDGVIGGQTRDAIARYQEDHGLAVTGSINEPLLRALDIR